MSNRGIDYFSIDHPLRNLISKISHNARKKMFARFMDVCAPTAENTVLDVGATGNDTLPESNFFEELYPHKNKLTVTSIENCLFLETKHPGLKFVQTNGITLPFEDKHFDIGVSLAVLEHVGSRENQRNFLRELIRVSKSIYVTTPDKRFPVEVHTFIPFIHWLPQRQHQAILRTLGQTFWAKTENLNLLYSNELVSLFDKDYPLKIVSHKTLGLSSNLIVLGGNLFV